ncbi:MAG: phenylacetate--CoA ligase [Lentisphaerae bacterium]|nr:phenylacetate--CoA ligase [Lentisphaerota bacterium]MBE6389167.1 phenylacetate--CoA ligase [Lentisphaerota bacterium]
MNNEIKECCCASDFMPVEKLRELQLMRLQKIVAHAYNNVEFFRNRMNEKNLKPSDIETLADISKLPFSKKVDLRDTYPFGLCAVPMSEVVRLHASSGTTGKPIVVAYTKEDLDVWAEVMKRGLAGAGLSKNDIIQVAYGYGLFTGGLGAHCGSEALGATVVPASVGNTQRQVMLMRDFGVTGVCCTPSYFLHLIEQAAQSGIDMRELPIRVGIFGAEPWSQGMREQLEKGAGIEAFDIYGLSEIIGPGVAIECTEHSGMHVFEDHFYPEIIDPDTGEVLPDGEFGELVLTTLSKYAMPMIRYRTRDLTRIIAEPCKCGRTIRRIDRISARSDDMFIIRGVNVFPSQIESALLTVPGVTANYLIILTTENGMDNIEVDVEISQEAFSDQVKILESLQKNISKAIESVIGLRIKVKLVAPQTIARSEGKAKRVIDKRTQIG